MAVEYAVVETGGRQYRVSPGDVISVEKLEAEPGSTVELDRVLLLHKDGDTRIGSPVVEGARAVARVLEQGRHRKVLVFKYKRKVNYRRRYGHRQAFTRLKVEELRG